MFRTCKIGHISTNDSECFYTFDEIHLKFLIYMDYETCLSIDCLFFGVERNNKENFWTETRMKTTCIFSLSFTVYIIEFDPK